MSGATVCGLLFLCVLSAPVCGHPTDTYTVSLSRAPPPTPAVAEGERVEISLAEAVALCLRDNRTIQVAYFQRITQKFDLLVAEDQFRPKLTVRSSYTTRQDGSGNGSSADVTPTATLLTPVGTQLALSWANITNKSSTGNTTASSNPSLTLTQPLLRGAGLNAATAPLRTARLDESINRMSLQATVSQEVTDIVLAYRSYLLAIERWRISQDALERSRGLMTVNQDLVASGRMAAVDLIQNESDIANQELAAEESANSKESARLALLEKLAIDQRTDLLLTEQLTVNAPNVNLDGALASAFFSKPEYLIQQVLLERAELGVDVAKDQRQWDLSLVAGMSKSNLPTTGLKSDWNRYGGVQLVVPLGDASLDRPVVQADVVLRTARLQLEGAHQQLEQQVRDAVRTVETRWRQVTISRRAEEFAAQKLEIEREKLKAGRSTTFQVLSFESDFRQAVSNRLSAVVDYMNALTLLDRQVGDTLRKWKITLKD